MTTLAILFFLICAHFLADFALQNDFVALHKNRNYPSKIGVVWPWVLGAHSTIHALFVAILTGSIALGVAEFIAHFLIDFAKCEKWIGFNMDQVLHLVCKLIWVYYMITVGTGGYLFWSVLGQLLN